MEIGKRLAYFRKGKGYSVNKLANLSGVAQSYLREVELGNRNPTVEFLSIVCDTMGVSLRDFFDEQPADRLLRKSTDSPPDKDARWGIFLTLSANSQT